MSTQRFGFFRKEKWHPLIVDDKKMKRNLNLKFAINKWARSWIELCTLYVVCQWCCCWGVHQATYQENFSHLMIHWCCKNASFIEESSDASEARVLYPIYETNFPYLASNWNTKLCFYASFLSFCLFPMQFQKVDVSDFFEP